MGAYFDLTAANAVLKELYFGQTPEDIVYKDNPFLALVEKKTDAGGKYIPVPLIYGVSQGRSSTFSNAQGNQTPVLATEFLLTRASDYSFATIDNQTMLASKGDKAAFVDGLKTVVDGAFRSGTLSAASACFRSGTGTIGQSNGMSTGVITLTNPDDVVQFDVGMTLQASATDGGAPRAAVGYVIAVDTMAGTVTVSATGQGGAAGNPASWSTGASGDFLLVQGDSNLKMKGLAGWLPTTAPTSSDNFFGVNRSPSPTRLAGVRVAASTLNIEEALIKAATFVGREGGRPNYAFTTFTTYSFLEMALGAKVVYFDEGLDEGNIAFHGIRINGPKGEIRVLPDRNCNAATAYLLTMDTWKLFSLNDVPHLFRYADGLEALRVYNQDAAEARVGYYAQLGCNAPGWNAVVTMPA